MKNAILLCRFVPYHEGINSASRPSYSSPWSACVYAAQRSCGISQSFLLAAATSRLHAPQQFSVPSLKGSGLFQQSSVSRLQMQQMPVRLNVLKSIAFLPSCTLKEDDIRQTSKAGDNHDIQQPDRDIDLVVDSLLEVLFVLAFLDDFIDHRLIDLLFLLVVQESFPPFRPDRETAAQQPARRYQSNGNYFFARYLRRSSATATMMTRPCAM